MLEVKRPLKLNPFQANLVSLLLVGTVMVVLLVSGIGYRNTRIGLLIWGGVVALALSGAIVVRPELGSYVLIVSLFTNMSSIFIDQGLPGINKPLVALVFLSVAVNRILSGKSLLPVKRSEVLLLAYGAVWFISSFVAQDQAKSLGRVMDFLKDFALVVCVFYPLASRPESWKRAMWLIIFSAGILAGLGTYQVLTHNTSYTFFGFSKFMEAQIIKNVDDLRLIGPLDDPNYYGQILVAVLPLALYRVLDERKFGLRLAAVGITFFIAFAIINTYSRGAFLAMLLVLLLIALERRVKFLLIIFISLAALVMMQFLPARFTDRLQTLFIFTSQDATVYADVSFRGRSSEMLTGINMFKEHPILGVGISNYTVHYQDYASRLGLERRTEDRQAHSLYLEIAAETGLLGLLTFGSLFAALIWGLTQVRRKLKILRDDYPHWATWIISLQMSFGAYLTTSNFLHGDYIRYLWLLVAMGIAMIHLADHLFEQAQAQLGQSAEA